MAAASSGVPDHRAQMAVEVFCYRITKYIGAYAAALGGVDALVFTAGIGGNDSTVRERVISGLGFMGLEVAQAKNDAVPRDQDVTDISVSPSAGAILVIRTDEELMIARDAAEIMR